MDFRDSADEAAFRERLRSWLSLHAKEYSGSGDEYWARQAQWHQALYQEGFFGLSWPRELGGQELPPVYDVIVDEELARAAAPPRPSVGYLIHGIGSRWQIWAPVLDAFQDAARRVIKQTGADVIIPGEAPLCLLLANNKIGRVDGVRLVKASTVEMMRENRLTEAQRQIPFMGLPFWMGQGFGLGLSMILDPQAQAWAGPSTKGSFSWPGAFGTWWRADPEEDMVAIYLIQNSMPLGPDAAAQVAASPRMGGRLALITFLNLLYGALSR